MNTLNEKLKYCLVGMYKKFVDEVDPKSILDFLIEKRIISIEEREKIVACNTRQEQCRTLLDKFFITSHPNAFIILKEAMRENYFWIVDELDEYSKHIQIEHQIGYERQLSNNITKEKVESENTIIEELKSQIKELENQQKIKNEEIIKLKNHIDILEYQIKTATSAMFKSEDILPDRDYSFYSDEADGRPISPDQASENIESGEQLEIMERNKLHSLKKLPRYCSSTYDLWVGQLEGSKKHICLKELLDSNRSIYYFPEVSLLIGLRHPRIANLLGRGPHDYPKPYVVLESSGLTNVFRCLRGQTFDISTKIITEWIVQLACGLEYLHDNKILHRSIFATNLILSNSGHSIKITNFQNSVMLGMKSFVLESRPLRQAEYSAPEIISQNKWSTATDVWSFGLTALKMWIKGSQIFPEMTQKDIMEFLSNARDDDMATFLGKHLENNPRMKETIQRCLSLKENNRPDMSELSSFGRYVNEEKTDTFTRKSKDEHMIACKNPVRGITSLSGVLYVIFMSSSSIKRYDIQNGLMKLKSIRLGPTTQFKLKSYFKHKDLNVKSTKKTLRPIKACSNNLKSIDSSDNLQCLYALDVGQSVIIQVNVQRQKITRSWEVPEEATCLSVTHNETILLGCCTTDYIALEFNSEGSLLSKINSGSITDGPWKANKVDRIHCLVLHGSIYSAAHQELCMLDNDGIMSSGYGSMSFDKISDVAIHFESGRILLADAMGNRIISVDRYIKSRPTEILNIHDGIIAPSSIYILENLLFVGLTSGNIYCFRFS